MGKKISNSQQKLAENIGEIFNRNKNQTKTRTMPLPLLKLSFDPKNARKFSFTPDDLPFNVDLCKEQSKIDEYNELAQMGEEIKKDGLINPISVYKQNDNFIIIAGHRRTLACLIVGLEYVDAIVRATPENDHQIARLQWNENDKRKNLSLSERLTGIERLVSSFSETNNASTKITSSLISEIANCSLTQAKHYLVLLRSDNDELLDSVKNGKINNLEKAAYIARLEKNMQSEALISLASGQSLSSVKSIKEPADKDQPEQPASVKTSTPQPGRKAKQINLGKTKNIGVAKYLLESVLESPMLEQQKANFVNKIDWNDLRDVNRVFKRLVSYLEKNVEEKQ